MRCLRKLWLTLPGLKPLPYLERLNAALKRRSTDFALVQSFTGADFALMPTSHLHRLFLNASVEVTRYTDNAHAQDPAFYMELGSRTSACSLAQSLLALANRNLHWHQDAKHWLHGVLRLYVARTQGTGALSEVDRRDGTLRPHQAKESVIPVRDFFEGVSD